MKKFSRALTFSFLTALVAIALTAFTLTGTQVFSNSLAQAAGPVKSPTAAVEDLKQTPPLDPSKLSESLPKNLFIELSKLINPAVVSISTSQMVRSQGGGRGMQGDPLQQFLEEFWGGRMGPGGPGGGGPAQQLQALGTGFIIRADGLIITNNHVVDQADVIKVQLDNNSNKFYEAEVVGRDARTDIALIKIDAKKQLPVAPLGVSANVQVGEWVAAFGNPYGHSHTMTKGIISAIGREIGEINRFPFLQTDASINPGNSGGPLVNTQGYVIGVNTAIDARAQGIGFAIPIDNVKTIVKQLEETGRVKRGFIGVGLGAMTPELAASLGLSSADGVVITQVMKNGPASKAGIQLYDIITDFGGKKLESPTDLMNAVADTPIGNKAKVKVIRVENDRKTDHSFDITVAENQDEQNKSSKTPGKRYFGQRAPFDLGFKIADLTAQLQNDFDLAPDAQGPLVIDVDRNSPASQAGLHPGDLILDVNKQSARKATDVIKLLRKGSNILRVARGNLILVVPLDNQK
jgi:serine protease Do